MKKPQYILVSFPRQGTDFLMSCFFGNPNHKLKYHREFFNPLCTLKKYKDEISKAFGSENNKEKIFLYDEKLIQSIYEKTWLKENFNITKEVFSFNKIPFYVKNFTVLSLFRHRCYTFPSTRPEYILPIFEGFLLKNYKDTLFLETQKYFNSLKDLNEIKKQVLIHTFCWYLQFINFQKFDINVLDFKKISDMHKNDLQDYLAKNLPEELCDFLLYKRIMDKRSLFRKEYNKLGVETICLDFIKFLQSLEVKLNDKYWDILI